jgi:hypothetical protein
MMDSAYKKNSWKRIKAAVVPYAYVVWFALPPWIEIATRYGINGISSLWNDRGVILWEVVYKGKHTWYLWRSVGSLQLYNGKQ